MKFKFYIIFFVVLLTVLGWGIKDVHAATFSIRNNVGVSYTVTVWYGTNRNNVQPTWGGQGVWGGNLTLNNMPDGWYTWNVQNWPSGWRLIGIDGAAYQQGGNVSWNVNWEPSGYTLNVSKSGSGSGTVTGGNGINCGSTCSAVFNPGNMVGLDATPSAGSVFAGWSSPCSGTGGCVFQINSDQSIIATFNSAPPPPPSVSVSVSPSTVNQGENVTVSWSVSGQVSGCTGTGNWPAWSGQSLGTSGGSSSTAGGLTENPTTFGVRCEGPGGTGGPDTKSVTVIKRYTLNVSKSGTGSGTVTGSGINCVNGGGDCSETYNSGNCIEYSHSEDPGSKWGGWSGACTGPGCIICFNNNQNLTATFNKKNPTVSITCSPGTVSYNSSANVSWSSNNTSNCTVSPTGWTGRSGSQSTGNLTSSQTYTVTCTGE